MSKYCYLAGPVRGLTFRGANQWRVEFAAAVHPIVCINPLRGREVYGDDETIQTNYTGLDTNANAVIRRDTYDVLNCDIVIANLLGAYEVSIGTMIELGIAHQAGIPIGVIIEPFGNPHEHAWFDVLAMFRTPDLDLAARQVLKMLQAYK